MTTVAVFGLGYVGCVTAACLAKVGRRVIGIDQDENKVQSLNAKNAPFFEPGLAGIIEETVGAGRLSATASVREALENADVALICVGTPSERNGNLGLDQLRRVCQNISDDCAGRRRPLVVAIRSTVFPGTCDEVVMPILGNNPALQVVSNPEFLREGVAVEDFLYPSLLVVGGHDRAAVELVAGLYRELPVEPCLVSLRTAEMIKYACNAFHAVKIAFANEIGALGDRLGVDGREVMATLCRDQKLNISKAYLTPGFAFGGSCLPKDLRALNYRANRLDVEIPLLESVLTSNREHLARGITAVLDAQGKIGIVGLAFKEDTDDLRESPVVALVEHLIGKGRNLRIHDPHISLESIYGSNRNFLLNAIPHISSLLEPRLDSLLTWADHLVVTQKPDAQLLKRVLDSGLPVVNLVGIPELSNRAALDAVTR
jgi:GDP-mannose 6-dehydrogenase